MIIIFIALLFSQYSWASSIDLDIGQTETVFNRFRIPNEKSNQITTPSGGTLTSFRLTGTFDLKSGNQLYLLYAPLQTSYNFNATKNFRFNDTTFSNGEDTEVTYKFNSYRIGYLWNWKSSSFRYWIGAVGKIRDATIAVSQGSKNDSYSNVGFVPLASYGFDWQLTSFFSIFHHTDALGSSRGAAYDSQIEFKINTSKLSTSLGKRILGGGADNTNVYNFAQFDTLYLKIGYLF